MKNAFPFVRTELPDWMVPVIEKVAAKMHDDATGHDLLHAVRVMELAGAIAKELGVEKEPTMTAGLLHDYYRKEEKQSGQLHYGPEAIAALRQEFGSMIAEALGKDGLEDVLAAIARHEEYYFDQDQGEDVLALPVLLQILQDADRIEAIGAVGVARTFMFGGAHGLPLAEDAEINANTWFDPGTRPKARYTSIFMRSCCA